MIPMSSMPSIHIELKSVSTDHFRHFLQHSLCAGLLDSVLPSHSPLDKEAQGIPLWQSNPNPL